MERVRHVLDVPKWMEWQEEEYGAGYGDSRWVCSGAGIGYEDAQRRPGIPG
jgi:hypothetical protein